MAGQNLILKNKIKHLLAQQGGLIQSSNISCLDVYCGFTPVGTIAKFG
ncbi:MAG: hypothetical protein ACJAVX_003511 [Pseudoalteromonas rhizosphaerae]|jgi:hypothetical protein